MVDPHIGIGPLPFGSSEDTATDSAKRNQALVDLAVQALRTGSREVCLDDAALARLATGDISATGIPASLDLVVVVAAASREAIDAGEFDLVVGPAVGSAAAGRMLGRFADFVPDAPQALAQVAAAEAERSPGRVVAELVYQPRARRLGNVSTRLNLRRYEIAIDLPASTDPDHTIGVDELVVGVRDGRFRLRWTRTGEDVMVTAGHMLTSTARTGRRPVPLRGGTPPDTPTRRVLMGTGRIVPLPAASAVRAHRAVARAMAAARRQFPFRARRCAVLPHRTRRVAHAMGRPGRARRRRRRSPAHARSGPGGRRG